jgi:hypothetical protein
MRREPIEAKARAAREDAIIKSYRSSCSLGEGKAVCILEGPETESIVAWLQEMDMPTDCITRLELEGDRGVIQES